MSELIAGLDEMEAFCANNTLAEAVEYWLEKSNHATAADRKLIECLLQAMYAVQSRLQ